MCAYLHNHTFCIDILWVCVSHIFDYTFTHILVIFKTIGIDPESGHWIMWETRRQKQKECVKPIKWFLYSKFGLKYILQNILPKFATWLKKTCLLLIVFEKINFTFHLGDYKDIWTHYRKNKKIFCEITGTLLINTLQPRQSKFKKCLISIRKSL